MRYLWIVLLGSIQLLQAQSALTPSLKCALFGLSDSFSVDELESALELSHAFHPYRETAVVNGRYYLAWIDPQMPQAPTNDNQFVQLLAPIRALSGISFAEPCLHGPSGEIAGLTNEVLIEMEPGFALTALEGPQLQPHPYLSNWLVLTLSDPNRIDPIATAAWLAGMDGIKQAEPNLLLQIQATTNDQHFFRQWNLNNTGAPLQGNGTPGADMSVTDAWTVTTGDPGIVLAIVDSGVDTAHPDLADNLLPGFDATGNGSLGYPNTNFASDGHGTACAGIAGAKGDNNIGVAGVCYDCSLLPVKLFTYIFNPFGGSLPFATGNDMATAITWAWQDGNASLINNSWGLADNFVNALPGGTGIVEAALDLALDSARNGQGIPMFFSSGNDGDPPIWPGYRDRLFSVNASTMCDERKHPASCDGEPWEGNWGDSLDVAAPGVRIPSTDMVGSNGYDQGEYVFEFNGTSAACPNAAGVMGLVMSLDSTLDLETYHQILESTCDKVGGYAYNTNLVNGTWSPELGYGRINAFAAVQMANPVSVIPSEQLASFISISPNPTRNKVQISLELPFKSHISTEIIDLQGRTRHVRDWPKLHLRSYSTSIHLESLNLPDGLYLLKIKTDRGVHLTKLLIDNSL